MFGTVVLGVSDDPFEDAIEAKKKAVGAKLDVDLKADDWKDVCEKFKAIIKKADRQRFSSGPLQAT